MPDGGGSLGAPEEYDAAGHGCWSPFVGNPCCNGNGGDDVGSGQPGGWVRPFVGEDCGCPLGGGFGVCRGGFLSCVFVVGVGFGLSLDGVWFDVSDVSVVDGCFGVSPEDGTGAWFGGFVHTVPVAVLTADGCVWAPDPGDAASAFTP